MPQWSDNHAAGPCADDAILSSILRISHSRECSAGRGEIPCILQSSWCTRGMRHEALVPFGFFVARPKIHRGPLISQTTTKHAQPTGFKDLLAKSDAGFLSFGIQG